MKIFEAESKFSATTTIEEGESDSETESSESEAETCADRRHHLQLPQNNRADESSDFIQFQRNTHDDAVDGANLSAMESTTDKRLCKPNENLPNNNFIKGSLEFNDAQPHLKLKWATLYIQMSFRPLTLRSWLDERNKETDFNTFYRKFIEKSVQQWNRTVVEEDDAMNKNGATAGAVAKYSEHIRRRTTASLLGPSLEKNLSKTWDTHDVALSIFIQGWYSSPLLFLRSIEQSTKFSLVHLIISKVLSGLNYCHLQNIVHHDIKPSNIFIGCEKNGDLYVQLGDFGLACPLEAKHSPDSMIGTMTYAAPEQLIGHCNPKVRSNKFT